MTDREYPEFSDGVWDGGEWISWDWINQQLDQQELRRQYPHADPELVEVFYTLLDTAAHYKALTGHYLQIWGELNCLRRSSSA